MKLMCELNFWIRIVSVIDWLFNKYMYLSLESIWEMVCLKYIENSEARKHWELGEA